MHYFMNHTFSFIIQHPLFNLHSFMNIKLTESFRGGLDNVTGKSGANELNCIVNEGFICINPSFQGFIQINPS